MPPAPDRADAPPGGLAGTQTGSPLTVGVALTHPVLRAATVLAGAGGLERQVEGVTVLDVADLDALTPNQLVLSSAYPLTDVPLRRLVERLAAAGASALGVKFRGFWDEPPWPLLDAANAFGLPLLSLPEGPFADLITPLLEEIAERQAERLRRAAGLHRTLIEASLRHEGPSAVAELLGRTLGVAVAVLGEDGELLAANARDEPWDEAELIEEALSASETVTTHVCGHACLIAPIRVGDRRHGTLVALDPPPDDPFVRAAMALTSVVAGIELLRRQQVAAVHRRYQRELLDDLAEGRLSESEARERAERLGWQVRHAHLVLVAVRCPPPHPRLDPGGAVTALGEDQLLVLSRAAVAARPGARPFWRAPGLGIVVHLNADEDPRAVAASMHARLAGTRRLAWVRDGLVLGVSRPTLGVVRFVDAFREATLAALLSSRFRRGDGGVAHFDDLGAVRVLALAQDQEALVTAARAALGELADGSRGSEELLDTLRVLLGCNLRLTQAADELFFHYNTIRHRFARLREMLGERLATPEGRLQLWMAVTALSIAETDARLLAGRRPPVGAH